MAVGDHAHEVCMAMQYPGSSVSLPPSCSMHDFSGSTSRLLLHATGRSKDKGGLCEPQ
jgi:hypothetical protein